MADGDDQNQTDAQPDLHAAKSTRRGSRAGPEQDEPRGGAAGYPAFRGMVEKVPHLLAIVE